MRATGFIFNVPRLLAAAVTLMAGKLIVRFGGFGNAATVVAPIYIFRSCSRTVFTRDSRQSVTGSSLEIFLREPVVVLRPKLYLARVEHDTIVANLTVTDPKG